MNYKKKRILYIEFNRDGTIGGSYFSLLYLIQGLDKKNFEPWVVFYKSHDLEKEFQNSSEKLFIFSNSFHKIIPSERTIPDKINRYLHYYFTQVIKNIIFLKKNQIKLVHLNNNLKTGHEWVIAAKILQIPVITHHRGYFHHYSKIDRIISSRFLSSIICISKSIKNHLNAHEIRNKRIFVVHNGLDPKQFIPKQSKEYMMASLGLHPDDFRIGIIGNLRNWKGQDVVVQAVQKLIRKIPKLRCLLVGKSAPEDLEYSKMIKRIIKNGGGNEEVVWAGYRRDIPDIINCLDIVIHASRNPEPFGRVALEAMALAKPIIATNAGGIKEIIDHEKSGLLIQPDDPEALASAIERFYLNPDLKKKYGVAGRKRLEDKFSLHQNVERTEAVYRELLGLE